MATGPQVVSEPGVEAIRKRPGMYVGDTSTYGVHHLVYFTLDAAADDALIGECTRMDVRLAADGRCTIFDDAIPVAPSEIEAVLTRLFFSTVDPHQNVLRESLIAVNALSSDCQLDVWWQSEQHRVTSKRGVLEGPPARVIPMEPVPFGCARGLRLSFLPDASIFQPGARIEYARIAARLSDLAMLAPGLTVGCEDEGSGNLMREQSPEGLVTALRRRAVGVNGAVPPFEIDHRFGPFRFRAGFLWRRDGGAAEVTSFANTVPTFRGGKHVTGFYKALGSAFAKRIREQPRLASLPSVRQDDPLPKEVVTPGLLAVVAIDMPRDVLKFEGPMKDCLGIDGLDEQIRAELAPVLFEHLSRHREELNRVQIEIEGRIWARAPKKNS